MATKVTKLIVNYDQEFDFTLLGISSAYKDYRLCYELNKLLGVEFVKDKNHELKLARETSTFQFGKYTAEGNYGRNITLLNNKQDENCLLPEVKMLDFLLIFTPVFDGDLKKLLAHIKEIKIVQAVVELNMAKIKSRYNLLA